MKEKSSYENLVELKVKNTPLANQVRIHCN